MKFRPKFLIEILLFSIAILVLVQPSLIISIQNITPKDSYPTDSLVMTTPPKADYPADLIYCYRGVEEISISVIFYNTNGNASWIVPAINEFERADITLTVTAFHYVNESDKTYYDFEYEELLTNFRTQDNSDLTIAFTQLSPKPSDTFSNLAGYSRVSTHNSIVLMPSLAHASWSYYIAIHEIAHNLGYFPNPNGHSSNANSIMFSVFSGTNIGFDSNDIDLLKSLH